MCDYSDTHTHTHTWAHHTVVFSFYFDWGSIMCTIKQSRVDARDSHDPYDHRRRRISLRRPRVNFPFIVYFFYLIEIRYRLFLLVTVSSRFRGDWIWGTVCIEDKKRSASSSVRGDFSVRAVPDVGTRLIPAKLPDILASLLLPGNERGFPLSSGLRSE